MTINTTIIRGDIIGATGPHGGVLPQSGSAQSVSPSPSLSMPSLQPDVPPLSSCGGVGVGVTVGVTVGMFVAVLVGVTVGVAVGVWVGI